MRVVAQCLAALDGATPWSPAFHEHLRTPEAAEERIDGDLLVILRAKPLFPVDAHLRDLAWKLQMARSLEDGEDSRFYLDRLLAWPELLYLSDDVPGAERLNAATRFCLAAADDRFDRDTPALPAACRSFDPAPGAPALTVC